MKVFAEAITIPSSDAVKAQRVYLEWPGFKVLIGLGEGRRCVKDVAFFQGTAFPGSSKMFEILLKTVPFGSALLPKLISTRK